MGAVDNRKTNAFMHACAQNNIPFVEFVHKRVEDLQDKMFDWNQRDVDGQNAHDLVMQQIDAPQVIVNKIGDIAKRGILQTKKTRPRSSTTGQVGNPPPALAVPQPRAANTAGGPTQTPLPAVPKPFPKQPVAYQGP